MRIEDVYNPKAPDKGLEIWVNITPLVAASIKLRVFKNALQREKTYTNRTELLVHCLKGLDLKANELVFAIDLVDRHLDTLKEAPISKTVRELLEEAVLEAEKDGAIDKLKNTDSKVVYEWTKCLPLYDDREDDVLLITDAQLQSEMYHLNKIGSQMASIGIRLKSFGTYAEAVVKRASINSINRDDD